MTKYNLQKVFDRRGRRVRGLWIRSGFYYAQMRLPGRDSPVRVPLPNATTVPEAVQEMNALKVRRRNGHLEMTSRKVDPGFGKFAEEYLKEQKLLAGKRPLTLSREASSLDALSRFFGERPLRSIGLVEIHAYANWRKTYSARKHLAEVAGRSIDVDVMVLRLIFQKALREGIVEENPMLRGAWKRLAGRPREVRLITTDEVRQLISAGGGQFGEYLALLAASGGREQETTRLRWSVNVDWNNRRLGFGQDGLSKFGKSRWVPFNPALESVLNRMKDARDPDNDYLFPSSRSIGPVKSFKKALAGVRSRLGMNDIGFHHFRHYFASHCAMSGVDLETVARWLGHEDLRQLSKVYLHITSDHSSRQAAKVEFRN